MKSEKYDPCIGCGFCCTKTMCGAGLRVHGINIVPCPSLEWNGDRHVCKLMTTPGDLGDRYKKELYAGEGCCANLNSWYYEPLIDRTKIKKDIPLTNPIPSMMQMFISVLAKEFMSSDAIFLVVNGFKGQLIKNGYSKEGAEYIGTRCMELFNNQKSRYMKDFIG